MAKMTGLGKGLDALFKDTIKEETKISMLDQYALIYCIK